MRINEHENFIELEVVDRVAADLPTPGDFELSVEVSSGKFRGQAFAWIDAVEFAKFIAQLRELERTRQGSAEFETMSPGVFRLHICAIDRQGHVAIEGMLVCHPNRSYRHSIEFGFEFDPTSLPKVLADFAALASGYA